MNLFWYKYSLGTSIWLSGFGVGIAVGVRPFWGLLGAALGAVASVVYLYGSRRRRRDPS